MTKSLYSVPQTALLSFNPGISKSVEQETQHLLTQFFLKTKYAEVLAPHSSTELELSKVSLYSLVEVLMRSQTLQDLRLQIAAEDVYLESAFRKFCEQIPWETFLARKTAIHLRVKSVGSRLFHESMLRDILADRLAKQLDIKTVKKDTSEKALTTVFAELQKNRCTLSLSLAGEPLYQRGFRESSGAIAPLREDLAQACLREALAFCHKQDEDFTVHNLWVPFGGTGTFVFEYLMLDLNLAPCILGRSYALEQLAFFNAKNFNFIQSKARAAMVPGKLKKIFYSDYAQKACEIFEKNHANFKERIQNTSAPESLNSLSLNIFNENFFAGTRPDFADEDVFLPINPPYGIRLHASSEIAPFYAKIARQVLDAKSLGAQRKFGGFILCPSEEAWSAFLKGLAPHAKTTTSHITQGGLDIRVCSFMI